MELSSVDLMFSVELLWSIMVQILLPGHLNELPMDFLSDNLKLLRLEHD